MLALVAGEGALPGVLIKALAGRNEEFRLCEVDGHPCPDRGDRPVMRFRIETLGTFLNDLVRYGTTEICFAGRINRPAIDPTLIDDATQPLIPDLMKALGAGDDAALRIVMRLFEGRGIQVRPPQDIAPDLLPAPGLLGKRKPKEQDEKDAQRGIQVIAALGAVDVGQSCIVANGHVLAVETMQGTDWMINTLIPNTDTPDGENLLLDFASRRIAEARVGARVEQAKMPTGGILIKAAKPSQDRRIDLPTIGPDTVRAASRARLTGIVIEAGGVFVLDQEAVVTTADHLGLFVWVKE